MMRRTENSSIYGLHRRRGSTYLIVLACAMLVTVIGIATLMSSRIQRRTLERNQDVTQARLLAQSGLETALLWIDMNNAWRAAYGEGDWMTNEDTGEGTITITVNDLGPNGDLALSADIDPVLITAIGLAGNARHKAELELEPEAANPIGALQVALQTGNDLDLGNATMTADAVLSANSSIDNYDNGGVITADLEAVNNIQIDGTHTGSQTTGVTARAMPDDATVFDWYVLNGTAIDYASLPSSGGHGEIINVVLSPASNPFGGGTNAQGIYVIDCGGGDIYIEDSRIVGTLVLLNVDLDTRVDFSLNWEPAVANLPVLLVDGGISFRHEGDTDLSEVTEGVNFNPVGTPYQGSEDGDTVDIYPSIIKGLIYVSGDMVMTKTPHIEGVMIVGDTFDQTSGTCTLEFDSIYETNPPSGFGLPSGDVQIAAETWRHAVD